MNVICLLGIPRLDLFRIKIRKKRRLRDDGGQQWGRVCGRDLRPVPRLSDVFRAVQAPEGAVLHAHLLRRLPGEPLRDGGTGPSLSIPALQPSSVLSDLPSQNGTSGWRGPPSARQLPGREPR